MMESQPLRRPEGQMFRVILCYIVSSQGQPGLQTLSQKKEKGKKKKKAETWLHLQALRLSCPCWRPSVGWGRKERQGRSQPVAMVYIFALLLIGLWGLVFHFTQPSCGTLALYLDKLQGLGGVPPQVSGCHPDWGRSLSLFPGGGCPGFSLM